MCSDKYLFFFASVQDLQRGARQRARVQAHPRQHEAHLEVLDGGVELEGGALY